MATRQDSVLRIRVGPPSVGVLGIVLAVLLAAAPLYVSLILRNDVARELESLYRSFGAHVPGISRILFAHVSVTRWIMFALTAVQLALLVTLTFQRTASARRRYFQVAIPCFVVALAVMAVLYAPAISIAAVV